MIPSALAREIRIGPGAKRGGRGLPRLVAAIALASVKHFAVVLAMNDGIFQRPPLAIAFLASMTFATSALLLFAPLSVARRPMAWVLGGNLAWSLLLWANLLTHRQFGGLVSLSSLPAASFLPEVFDAAVALMRQSDWLLFADLPLLWILAGKAVSGRSSWPALLGLAVLVAGMKVSPRAERPWDGDTHLAGDVGLLGYHLFDAASAIRAAADEKPATREEAERVAMHLRARPVEADVVAGPYEGANVIFVLLESFQGFLLEARVEGRAVVPHLEALAEESVRFPHALSQIAAGSTSDAEFAAYCSLQPASRGAAFLRFAGRAWDCLPSRLAGRGYETVAFHANRPGFWNRNRMYPAMGIERFVSERSFRGRRIGLGTDDVAFLEQVADHLEGLREPFFATVLTLTSHIPFDYEEIPRAFTSPSDPALRRYLDAAHYTDGALGGFLAKLRASGLLDRSILVVYGDHHGVTRKTADLEAFLGLAPSDGTAWLLAERGVPLLLRLPRGEGASRSDVGAGQIDLAPTVSALLGLDWSDSAFLGENLLSAEATGRVVLSDTSLLEAKDGRVASGSIRSESCSAPPCDELFRWGMDQLETSKILTERGMVGRIPVDRSQR